MKNKKKIISMTLLSCLLFCLVIVLSSLSPLSETGDAANEFNSAGMWISVMMMMALYVIPLLLYSLGLEWMKYIMAIMCVLGVLIYVFLIVLVTFFGALNNIIPSLLPLLAVSGIACLINVVWFFTTFSKKSEESM